MGEGKRLKEFLMMPWGPGGGFWLGAVFMLLIWTLIILGVVALVAWLAKQSRPGAQTPTESPLDVLNKRYARGEIGKEEYESIKKDLA
jgi:putative membrane protein